MGILLSDEGSLLFPKTSVREFGVNNLTQEEIETFIEDAYLTCIIRNEFEPILDFLQERLKEAEDAKDIDQTILILKKMGEFRSAIKASRPIHFPWTKN